MSPQSDIPRWSKAHPNWGSGYRAQKNAYAMRVSLAMTGGQLECPACGDPFDMTSDSATQVDRAIPSLDYRPANIAMICEACNQGRSLLQNVGSDWTRIADYIADIARASAMVDIPSIPEAKREIALLRSARRASHSRYA